MGVVEAGPKGSPLPQRIASQKPRPGLDRPLEVEVTELTLDDDEFSTTFGTGTSQFAELSAERGDPWTSRLRLD